MLFPIASHAWHLLQKGKKNKKFIDKKTATTFVVLNRGADAKDVTEKVYQPVKPPNLPKGQKWSPQLALDHDSDDDQRHANNANDNNNGEDSRDEEQPEYRAAGNFRPDDFALGEYGFPDDGYDYGQHFAPLGGGKWFAAAAMGQVTAANRAAKVSATAEPSLVAPPPADVDFEAAKVVVVKDNGRVLARGEQFADADSDEEVRRMLEDSGSSDEGGDLADDFVVSAMLKGATASGEKEKEKDDVEQGKESVKKPVADRVRFADADFEDDDDEDESFRSGEEDDEDEEPARRAGGNGVIQFPERVAGGMVDDWLDHLMENEYDNEQLGEGPEALNHASSEHRGKVFANDLEDYMAEYLEVKNVPSSTAYKNGEELGAEEREKTLLLARKGLEAPDEVVMIETSVKETDWDCESILTTYSNVANHPKVLEDEGGGSKKTRKPKQPVAFADAPVAAVAEDDAAAAAAASAVNKGVARKKEETPEQRKARKAAVKAERKAARETKKSLKMSYKAEAASQKTHVNAVPFYSQTVIPMNN
jgi:protein LTV1